MNHNFSFSRREVAVLDTLRENKFHRSYKNYTAIHKPQSYQPTAKLHKAALKIQKFWRTYLQIRRNHINHLISLFQVEITIQKKELDGQLLFRKVIEKQIGEQHRLVGVEVEEVLGDTKQAIMDFVGVQFKNSRRNSNHLENLRLAGRYQEKQMASSLNEYLEARGRKQELHSECSTLDQQLKSLNDRIDLLNNKLIGDNAQRLKIEAEYQHILNT